jgi:hypothetical protein
MSYKDLLKTVKLIDVGFIFNKVDSILKTATVLILNGILKVGSCSNRCLVSFGVAIYYIFAFAIIDNNKIGYGGCGCLKLS